MSRITEALARAHGRPAEPPTARHASPWDFEKPDSQEPGEGWDFTEAVAVRPGADPLPTGRPAVVALHPGRRIPDATATPMPPGAPVVPMVPAEAYAEKLIGSANMEAGVVEQYRRLGAALFQAQATGQVRVVMVASAMPDEGKTLVASNLALVLSGSYHRKVLLIDADLRRPSVHSAMGLPGSPGIAERLSEGRTVVPVAVAPRLHVLVAGTPQADPMGIVTSDDMHRLVASFRSEYDWVIIDTPPVALLSDTHLLASMVDRVLLVIQAGKTSYELVQKSIATIGKERILGTVLNRAGHEAANAYGGTYSDHYGAGPR